MNLLDTWTLYDHSKSSKEIYGSNIRTIGTVKMVEEFSNVIGSYPEPGSLFTQILGNKQIKPFIGEKEQKKISALSLFKNGIRPEWEDEMNADGGELQFKIILNSGIVDTYKVLEDLNVLWYKLILCTLSGYFTDYSYITGIRIIDNSSVEKLSYRLEIWHSRAKEDIVKNLEREISKCLMISEKLVHKTHSKC